MQWDESWGWGLGGDGVEWSGVGVGWGGRRLGATGVGWALG